MHSLERWLKFSKGRQMHAIAAELMRAKMHQNEDKSKFLSAMERALDLVDLTLEDARWQGQRAMLFWLRDEICKFYLGTDKKTSNTDLEVIYNAL